MYSNDTDIVIISIIMIVALIWLLSLFVRSRTMNCVTKFDSKQERVIDEMNAKAIELGYDIGSMTDAQMEEVLKQTHYRIFKANPFVFGIEKTK